MDLMNKWVIYMKNRINQAMEMCNLPLNKLRNATIFITGATGLIGSVLVKVLLSINDIHNLNLKLLLLIRDESKVDKIILKYVNQGIIKLLKGDILNISEYENQIDYIIHGASITTSKSMIEKPVEVIKTNVEGTINVLELARKHKVNSVIYLSSMEVYGSVSHEEPLTEEKINYLNPLLVRSCYPESKKMAENICVSYWKEYNVPVKIIRLAQTFGEGVKKEDTRVFAEFARCALKNEDIKLASSGNSKRMYLDTFDACTAIMIVLLKGENGEAYNAANKNTYCSIKEMADLVVKNFSKKIINVYCNINEEDAKKYPPEHKLYLDVSKLENLQWQPICSLIEMYSNMIKSWKLIDVENE